MSNQRESYEDDRKRDPLGDMGRKARGFRSSPLCRHLRGVQRESLLAVRSLVDMFIDRLEECDKESPVQPTDTGQPASGGEGRKVPVE